MHLESPIFLGLFPILLLSILYLWWMRRRSDSPAIRFSALDGIQQLPKTVTVKLLPTLKVIRYIVIILLIFVLARPHITQSQVRRFREGIDIFLALDISKSMLAEDFVDANRLQTAKLVIRDFLRNRANDRIGLVVFSGESFTLCPLTFDYTVLIELLEDVKISMDDQLEEGTAIGDAIATTTDRLRYSDAKTKIVILLTDGENNAGIIEPEVAASLAQSFGIKVYTIGMGKEGGALIPYEATTFGKRYRKEKTYLDENTLKRIANITDARYFQTTNVQSLKQVYTEIDRLEKTEFEVINYTKNKEIASYFLMPAVLLLGLELLLSNTVLRKIP